MHTLAADTGTTLGILLQTSLGVIGGLISLLLVVLLRRLSRMEERQDERWRSLYQHLEDRYVRLDTQRAYQKATEESIQRLHDRMSHIERIARAHPERTSP